MEKTIEIISGEDGVTVVVRPMFPFVCETFSIEDQKLTLEGEGKAIPVRIHDDQAGDLVGVTEILLVEYAIDGAEPRRELLLSSM